MRPTLAKSFITKLLITGASIALILSCAQNPQPIPRTNAQQITGTKTTNGLFLSMEKPGDISIPDLIKVTKLVADPSSLTMKVGETFSLFTIRIQGFDKDNRSLGNLPFFDIRGGTGPGSIELQPPNIVVGKSVGFGSIVLAVPMYKKSGGVGDPPSVTIQFNVIN